MNRQQSMATIDAALQTATQPASAPVSPTVSPVVAPHPAPGVAVPTPITGMTADEKRGYDADRQDRLDQEKADAQASANAKQEPIDKLNKTAATIGVAQRTANAIGDIATGAKVKIADIPTPGSILFPLVVLLVFFFLLIPVNGHTRLTWLWLAITNNADITQGATGQGGGDESAISTLPMGDTPSMPVTPALMTGVEDIS